MSGDAVERLLGFTAELGDGVRQEQLRYRLALFIERSRQLVDRLRLQFERPSLALAGCLESQGNLARRARSFARLDCSSHRAWHLADVLPPARRQESSALRGEGVTVFVDEDVPPRSHRLVPATANEALRSEPVQDGRRTYAQSRCRYGSRDLAGHPLRVLA